MNIEELLNTKLWISYRPYDPVVLRKYGLFFIEELPNIIQIIGIPTILGSLLIRSYLGSILISTVVSSILALYLSVRAMKYLHSEFMRDTSELQLHKKQMKAILLIWFCLILVTCILMTFAIIFVVELNRYNIQSTHK